MTTQVTRWDDIANEIGGEFRQVPQRAVRSSCHRNSIRILRETRVWRAMATVPLTQGRHVYQFIVPDLADVEAVATMQLLARPADGGRQGVTTLEPIAREEALQGLYGLPFGWPDGPVEDRGQPTHFMEWGDMEGSRDFAVAPTPDGEKRYIARPEVVLTMSSTAQGVPPAIYVRIRELMRSSVLWDIFAQRDQPWGSESRAAYYRQEYKAMRNRMRTDPGIAQKRRRVIRGRPW